MAKNGPIVLIDDDIDDLELYKEAFKSLHIANKVIIFDNPTEALEYLKARIDPCFFILCDINMPEMDGLTLRQEFNKDKLSKLKMVPFLFLSTSDRMDTINTAYKLSIQGYFKKPSEFKNIQKLFKDIISYWSNNLEPSVVAA